MGEQAIGAAADDHVRGARDAELVVIEYGDFQCPYCGRARPTLAALQERHGARLALVYRHLPLEHLHPLAGLAAEAAEAAAAQGQFWGMHDALFEHQKQLNAANLPLLAQTLGLDVGRFRQELESRRYRDKVRAHADDAARVGATGTPTFFFNGRRYHGDSDRASLTAAIEAALGGR
ncbi:DsbA family protein [Massilia sp. ST3]|uniref:DsbA family protein n=1 Tax=Massilia sp. ST3 TaxID=2824903 RepID=UPI001B845BF9|nr:DsbA family protein [Massilia sp. ST3]MBQ5948610.1 thioredoxin domain-containing protein [Massilia sp. ST3]